MAVSSESNTWCNGIYTTVILPWELNGSIYIATMPSKRNFICIARGSFPGKRVFLGGGLYCRENGAGKAFGGSILKMFVLLKSTAFQNVTLCATVGGRTTVVYIYICTIVILPWDFNSSIYIPTTSKRNLICIARGGKRVFLVAYNAEKMGFGKLLGEVS